jgi:hypothetical protein
LLVVTNSAFSFFTCLSISSCSHIQYGPTIKQIWYRLVISRAEYVSSKARTTKNRTYSTAGDASRKKGVLHLDIKHYTEYCPSSNIQAYKFEACSSSNTTPQHINFI